MHIDDVRKGNSFQSALFQNQRNEHAKFICVKPTKCPFKEKQKCLLNGQTKKTQLRKQYENKISAMMIIIIIIFPFN